MCLYQQYYSLLAKCLYAEDVRQLKRRLYN